MMIRKIRYIFFLFLFYILIVTYYGTYHEVSIIILYFLIFQLL